MVIQKRQRKPQIHISIKKCLGYADTDSDSKVYEDWTQRTTRVCKPCWELKYCPYGPLVEQLPLLPSLRSEIENHVAYLKRCLETNTIGTIEPLSNERHATYQEWLADENLLLHQAYIELQQQNRLEEANRFENQEESISAWLDGLGGKLPPVHIYRASYKLDGQDLSEDDFAPEIWKEILARVEAHRQRLNQVLTTGIDDRRTPLEPVRRAWFQKQIAEFLPEDYPEIIPQQFTEATCKNFGHICPVFFAAEEMTETRHQRRIGRRKLNFKTMMRIVRRDDYCCQNCQKRLKDDEVEFDHIIPVSKGGSSEEHNLRLTCFDCNRGKRDNFIP